MMICLVKEGLGGKKISKKMSVFVHITRLFPSELIWHLESAAKAQVLIICSKLSSITHAVPATSQAQLSVFICHLINQLMLHEWEGLKGYRKLDLSCLISCDFT